MANFDLVGAARLAEDLPPRERFLRLADRHAEAATALGFSDFHVFGWHAGPAIGMARSLAARLPDARLKTIAGYGTLFFVEKPKLLRQTAGAFLQQHSFPEGSPDAAVRRR